MVQELVMFLFILGFSSRIFSQEERILEGEDWNGA